MAQVQIRDTQGRPIGSVAVRLATADRPNSDQAYDERFTDAAGNTAFPAPVPSPSYVLHVNHTDDCCGRGLRAKYDAVSQHVPSLDQDIQIVLPAKGSGGGRPFPPERGTLRARGLHFEREDGSVFGWRGATWFMGFGRFLRGEDVSGHLERFVSLGVNVVRVFGRVPWGGEWEAMRDPTGPDAIWRFFALLADHGLRCQFVPLTYADGAAAQRRRVQEAYDAAVDYPLVTIEIGNENHVNNIDTAAALSGVNKHGVLSCSGEYLVVSTAGERGDGVLPAPPYASFPLMLDYGDLHTERNDRYARNGKEPLEFMNVTGKPWIDGEPWGFGEVDKSGGGSRTTNLAAAVGHHAIAQLMCAGSCLHTQAGLEGRAPDPVNEPVQTAMCEAVAKVWRFLPEHVYTGLYSRPHLGNFPLVWRDDDSDSSTGHAYASLHGDTAYTCVPLPRAGWEAQAVSGWRIAETLDGWPNVLKLEKA